MCTSKFTAMKLKVKTIVMIVGSYFNVNTERDLKSVKAHYENCP